MLHPTLQHPETLAELRRQWRRGGNLRIAPFLREDVAEALLAALQPQPFTLVASISSELSFQYWRFAMLPEPSCDHVLCRFGRWLWSDGTGWLSRLTGLPLAPPEDRIVQSSLYTKGCYLDVHNDHDGARQLAFIIGLTRPPTAAAAADTDAAADADAGGQLEFLRVADGRVEVVERRLPGWNSVDIFDARASDRLHRVRLVERPMPRRALFGWLYRRPQ